MTIHEMLRRTLRAGVETLPFDWEIPEIEVPVEKLVVAVHDWVGEDVDEHTRTDYIEHCKEWRQTMIKGDEADRIIAHIVRCLNIGSEWEQNATNAIYKAIAKAMLR